MAIKEKWNDPVKKDDLIEIAQIINSLRYLSGDMLDDYFNCYKNPLCDVNDRMAIVWNFKRYGAYMTLLDDGILRVEAELKKLDITI